MKDKWLWIVIGATLLIWWNLPIGSIDRYGIVKGRVLPLPLKLTQEDAVKACKSHGRRLATILEIVYFNGQGYSPGIEKKPPPPAYAVQEISALNPDGTIQNFKILYSKKFDSDPMSKMPWKSFMWSSSASQNEPTKFYTLNMDSRKAIAHITNDPDDRFRLGIAQCVPEEAGPWSKL